MTNIKLYNYYIKELNAIEYLRKFVSNTLHNRVLLDTKKYKILKRLESL